MYLKVIVTIGESEYDADAIERKVKLQLPTELDYLVTEQQNPIEVIVKTLLRDSVKAYSLLPKHDEPNNEDVTG